MFHKDSYDYVDENKLRHEYKDDKEDGSNDMTDATVG